MNGLRLGTGVWVTILWLGAAWWGTRGAPASVPSPAPGAASETLPRQDVWEAGLKVVEARDPAAAARAREVAAFSGEAGTDFSGPRSVEFSQTPLMRAVTRKDPFQTVTAAMAWERVAGALRRREGAIKRAFAAAALVIFPLAVLSLLSNGASFSRSFLDVGYFGVVSFLWVEGLFVWALKLSASGAFFADVPQALWRGPLSLLLISALGTERLFLSRRVTVLRAAKKPQAPFVSSGVLHGAGSEPEPSIVDRLVERLVRF